MRNPTAGTGIVPATAGSRVRDGQLLLDALAVIDVEGWDCPTATEVLNFIREDLIRPLAVHVGLRGAAAWQAESTAWAAVWLTLCEPSLRSARSPWGVVWQTARRALVSEILTARWGTHPRRAWEHHAEERAGVVARTVSLQRLLESEREPPVASLWPGSSQPDGPVAVALRCAVGALVGSGWDEEVASRIIAEVASMEDELSHDATAVGWRPLAAHLGLAPWQARRLILVLRGSVDRPGLLARLLTEGPCAVEAAELRTALAGTITRRLPCTARPQVPDDRQRHPQELAS